MSFDFKSKPTGLWKHILHAPTWLYRARLGFLLGKRFVMIEHRGRKSDRRYRTVIEVAGRGDVGDSYIVTSGTGPRADWYQNIRAGKLDAVWVGSQRHSSVGVSFLDSPDAAAVFKAYESAHPKTAEKLMASMGVTYDGTDDGRVDMMDKIPMVEFTVG
ncbi:MAG: nitroreductase family deazaflavin-dependent oxidoreductase [Acidimicrobiia bacterium]|nr:nitroreductase family deazaflavin-dependent oxidoreductase [Acidimicrobiia bacterium]